MFVRARDRSLVLELVLFRHPEDHKVIVHICKSLFLIDSETIKTGKYGGHRCSAIRRTRHVVHVRPRRPRRNTGPCRTGGVPLKTVRPPSRLSPRGSTTRGHENQDRGQMTRFTHVRAARRGGPTAALRAPAVFVKIHTETYLLANTLFRPFMKDCAQF